MGWKKINGDTSGNRDGDEFIKWDEPKEIEGIWLGSFISQRGTEIGKIEHDGQVYAFTMPTVLSKSLKDVPVDKLIRIEYEGISKTQTGRDYKSFSVFEDDSTAF